jgi:hypothetical protein
VAVRAVRARRQQEPKVTRPAARSL